MNIFNKNRDRKGITLIEVIIAVGILAIGSITATGLIIGTIRSTILNKNYLIAVNLAREGVEAVRSIRDTNWMKFSYNTDECWDVLEDDVCPSTEFLQGASKQTYRINPTQATFKWKLEKSSTAEFVPTVDVNARKFYLLEQDKSEENNFVGNYRHLDVNEYAEEGTSFYRAITMLEYETDSSDVEAIKVASVVQWLERGKIQETIAETILTNY